MRLGLAMSIGTFVALALWVQDPQRASVFVSVAAQGTCTVTAANATLAAVSSAVASASNGDTVCVPAGTVAWTSALSLTGKAITLRGGIGGTTAISRNGTIFSWNTTSGGDNGTGLHRITGFSLSGDAGDAALIGLGGGSNQVRIDTNIFTSLGNGLAIRVSDYVRGVVDHNTCTNGSHFCFRTQHGKWGNAAGDDGANDWPGGLGNGSWGSPDTMGTADMMYFENNTINWGGGYRWATDDYRGARVVYRFNQWNGAICATHGTETSALERGIFAMEYYGNSHVVQGSITDVRCHLRSGHGLVFLNSVPAGGLGGTFFHLTNYRGKSTTDTHANDKFFAWGGCGTYSVASITRSGSTATLTTTVNHRFKAGSAEGFYFEVLGANQSAYNGVFHTFTEGGNTISWTVAGSPTTPATGTIKVRSPFDENRDEEGGNCLDQPGMGTGDRLDGDLYPMGADYMSPVPCCHQTLMPVRGWLNTNGGTYAPIGTNQCPTCVQNVHYYNQNASCTGSSCTAGIGVGTTLPTSCTTGVGFWETDAGEWNSTNGATPDGRLWECTSTNIWSLKYGANTTGTPYSYPHLLVSGQVTASPAAPSNLRITTAMYWSLLKKGDVLWTALGLPGPIRSE